MSRTGPTVREPRGRLEELDALRGLAALYVALHHYTAYYDEMYGHGEDVTFSLTHGSQAVAFFFVISGFVIFMTLDRTRRWTDFVISRFARLFPAYWTGIAATFLVVRAFGLPGRELSVMEALKNSVMVHGLFGVRHVDGVYWSLEVEVFFYAVMVGVFLAGLLPRIQWVLLAWMALGMAHSSAGGILPERAHALLGRALILDHVHLFAVGIAFHAWWKARSFSRANLLVVAAAVAREGALNGADNAWLVGAFCFVFALVATGQAEVFANRVLVFFGTISYPFYLIHQNIGYVVIRALQARGVGVTGRVACALAVTLPLAVALAFLIERPLQRALRALLRRLHPAAVGSAASDQGALR